ncbi:deoxycytidyl transferase [Lignoscripta atroalba]|nr:deoxycytidyl transferase [Lignoscripta atroalba]
MGSRLDTNSSAVRKRIEKHKFDNEEGEEYEPSKFGGFTDYFRRKKIKLQNLDAQRRISSTDRPAIFRGVVAHVNGYTQPSLNDLHALIVDHGGGFMQYLDGKTTVTHIIASNLTPKKKIEFRKYRIVKPAWVVDSVKAGRLLPWDSYRVVDEGIGQQVLGFDHGNVISQVNTPYGGYRDQTDTSWYTERVKSIADELDGDMVHNSSKLPFPSTQAPTTGENAPSETDDYSLSPRSDTVLDPAQTTPSEASSPSGQSETSETELQHNDVFASATGNGEDLPAIDAGLKSSFGLGDLPNPEDTHQGPPVYQPVEPSRPDLALGSGETESPEKGARMTAEEHNAVLLADPRVWKSTGVNPGFLQQYYEESRLHHLSAWKAELKSQLQALAAEKSSSQKVRPKRNPGSRRYILHVDFDSFFAAVSLKKFPQYVDKPAVVAHGGGSGAEIASCNYPARKFGVKNGMWMKTAQQLCPDLKVLPYDFKAYEDASRDFYEAIMSTGGIVQSVSVDEALVDVTAACIEAGGHEGKGIQEGSIWREQAMADEIAQGLRDQIKEKTGCAVSVGIGGNILLAKVALRKAKPAGQYQIKPEEVLAFIGNLTVQDLPGVAYSIGGKLEEIRVKYVKDIRELSKERLMSTLGPKTGEKLWDYSRGIDRTEVGEQVIRKSVSAEVNWGIRFVTQEQADEFVQSLCDELHKRLVNEKVKGRQLTMKMMRRAADAPLDPPKHLGHGKCDTFNKSVVLGVATNAKEVLGREAISIMRGWGFSPGELRGIGVQVTKLELLKGPADNPLESSQRRLQFKTSTSIKPVKQCDDTIIDDIESPRKPRVVTVHPAAAITASTPSDAEPSKPLNTLGTQFVLPTQVDPEVLAELPADIRSRILPKSAPEQQVEHLGASPPFKSRSNSPSMPPDTFPSQSQLDQETLEALPADVRAEILAFYQRPPSKPRAQALLPQSPRKNRTINPSSKKATTPTKKRTGLLFRGKQVSKRESNSTLTQSNFVSSHITSTKSKNANPGATGSDTDEVSSEFLDALPEDIRREVLAQQRRDRLKKKGGIDITAKKKSHRPAPANQPPSGQRRLRLLPRPAKPTFTSRKLSVLPDLRDAVSAWFEEFKDEGPYDDDVNSLVAYLTRVVVEERDMAKSVAVVRWLAWVVDQGGGAEGKRAWAPALQRVEDGVQKAVGDRSLGKVVF